MADNYEGVHVNDDVFPFKKTSVWISWRKMEGIGTPALDEGGSTTFAIGAGTISAAGAGTPLAVECHDLDIYGLSIAANDDAVHLLWTFPDDMDMSDPQLEFALCFIHESTDADEPVWEVHRTDLAKQQEMVNAIAAATETLEFDAHTCSTTDETFEITSWFPVTTQPAAADVASLLAVQCKTMAASANEIRFLQLGIRYKVNMLYDRGPTD